MSGPVTIVSAAAAKPELFFSYSTAEDTNVLLRTIIWMVFSADCNVRWTPSALTSGQSQLAQIPTIHPHPCAITSELPTIHPEFHLAIKGHIQNRPWGRIASYKLSRN